MDLSTTIKRNLASTLAATALLWGCSSSNTSGELSDARKAYDDAARSPAATYRPGELTRARTALDRAEDAHQADPGSKREVRLASAAEREADIAKSDGDAVAHERAASFDRAQAKRDRQLEGRAADNRETSAKAGERADKEPVQEQPGMPPVKPIETRASDQRSSRASAALQGLSQVATVKEEPRGVVITMSGALLFPSGQTELTPIARQNLDRVASAIEQQPGGTTVSVEGYTDAQGGAQENQRLSEKRAQAVADHLLAQGIAKQVSVVGHGEADPVADNATPEGRASNRRVEIVLAREAKH